jgi:hypothetical protein
MKKIHLLALAVLLVFGIASKAQAGTNAYMYLNLTIVQAGININSHFSNITWGVANGQFSISTSNVKGTIENTGADTVDLQVKCTNSTGWTPSTTTNVTASAFCLQGLFCNYAASLIHSDFAADDVITDTLTVASSTAFARPGDVEFVKGHNMPSSQVVNMRFRFKPPTGVVNGTQKSVTIKVRAIPG